MPVDVTAARTIGRPRDEVAAYLRDPANDTSWIGDLRSARLLTRDLWRWVARSSGWPASWGVGSSTSTRSPN
jgi:hypothetical protein